MTRRAVFLAVVPLFLLLILASCASQKAADPLSFDKAQLLGMIYDEDNQPCSGVQLGVDGGSGPLSDIRGRFIIADLSRGEHHITARKTGYEDLDIGISFLNRTDVLHLSMTSFSELLADAEASLRDLRWAEAEAFLKRAEKIDPVDAVLGYLFAVHAYRTGSYSAAADRLESLVAKGNPEPAVYLFLADIYETNLGDLSKAAANLEKYIALRADPEAQKRLEALKAKLTPTE